MRLLMRFILAAVTTWCVPLYVGAACFPPSLSIQGFGQDGEILFSALVVAKKGVEVPVLMIGGIVQRPNPISSPFMPGWEAHHYLFKIPKKGATFDFGSKHFNVPAFENGLRCLYTSCADAQPGVSENWKKFYAFANQSGANVHLKGGDNIPYPDTGLGLALK